MSAYRAFCSSPFSTNQGCKIPSTKSGDEPDFLGHYKSGIPDLQTFSEGLRREYLALSGALTFSYNNGPVE